MGTRIGATQVNALGRVLREIGIRQDEECTRNTPQRWLKGIAHYAQDYDPENDLSKTFGDGIITGEKSIYQHGMVVQSPIPYRALCAHHLFPVLGVAHVGYIPANKVVGLSKLARLVYGISHSEPSLQEDVGNKIADALMQHLGAHGSMCVISATHGCMACRGIEEHNVLTTTSSLRGVFITDVDAKSEFYRLVELSK